MTFFENVVKPMVLATFCSIFEARNSKDRLRALLSARTPTVRDLFGELNQKGILSTKRAPEGRLSGQNYDFVRPNGPCGFTPKTNPPTLSEAGRRVRVHFVYHLPEVIVRRNALLVKSQTGKCQVGVGGAVCKTPPGEKLAEFNDQYLIFTVFKDHITAA